MTDLQLKTKEAARDKKKTTVELFMSRCTRAVGNWAIGHSSTAVRLKLFQYNQFLIYHVIYSVYLKVYI